MNRLWIVIVSVTALLIAVAVVVALRIEARNDALRSIARRRDLPNVRPEDV